MALVGAIVSQLVLGQLHEKQLLELAESRVT